MPLYIRDNEVALLARKLQTLSKARTVTEAVRMALEHEVERVGGKQPPSARLAPVIQDAQALGQVAPAFDMKRFSDELWEAK